MKKFKIYKNIQLRPSLFGLPMEAGGLFFALAMVNALIFIFMPVHPLIKIAGMILPAILIYVIMLIFFSHYTFESFYKKFNSKHIKVIQNKSLSVFKNDLKD